MFSGGGGALAFMAGYSHGMIEIVGKQKLQQYETCGLSAGSIIALVFHYAIRQDSLDMRYFYKEWFRKGYQKENRKYGGLFTNGRLIKNNAIEYMKLLEQNPVEHINDKVHIQISTMQKGIIPKKKIVSQFKDGKQLGEALCSSCNVPFLMDFSFFSTYQNQKTLDGGLTGLIPYKYENSQKKVFVNVLPRYTTQFPLVWKQPRNIQMLHISENAGIKFPQDYWIWDQDWSDDMFMKGVKKAENDSENLIQIFQE